LYKKMWGSLIVSFAVLFGISDVSSLESEEYIVMFDKKIDYTALKKMNVQVVEEYSLIPAVVVKGKPSFSQISSSEHGIKDFDQNEKVKLIQSQSEDWGINHIKTQDARQLGFMGNGINVAVIDTGVEDYHPDLTRNNANSVVVKAKSFITENVYCDDTETSMCTDDGSDDYNGHGTHVTGIIAAQNNDYGTVGVAPNVNIFAVKVLDKEGIGYLSDVISGIEWSVENGADVINLSLGFPDDQPALKAAVDAAEQKGVIVIASAGNESDGSVTAQSLDNMKYPAKYPSVIAVGSIDSQNNRSVFSSVGDSVELSAPGSYVYSTFINNSYTHMDGTSMAAPYVSGMAALYLEAYPNLSNRQIRTIMGEHSLDLGTPGRDREFGLGLVQSFHSNPLEKKVTVFRKTSLHHYPKYTSKTNYNLGVQTLTVLEEFGDWYKINSWVGTKWIHKNNVLNDSIKYNKTMISILVPIDGYYGPAYSSSKVAKIGIRQTTSDASIHGWYRISYGSGKVWIKPNSYTVIGDFKPSNVSILSSSSLNVYDLPTSGSKFLGKILPQEMKANASSSNGWYRVNTKYGMKWVQPKGALVGTKSKISTPVHVTQKTLLYKTPFQMGWKPYIAPQRVVAVEKWGNWYKINTYLGPRWISDSHVILGDKMPFSSKMTLTSAVYLYKYPNQTGWKPSISSQTVTVTEKWGNWYKINTYLGPRWIKK